MEPLQIVRDALLALHIFGLTLIIGTFFVQMRRKSDFSVGLVLAGAITQLVTGLALVGVAEARDFDVNNIKIAVKLGVALIVLIAAIVAFVKQRKGRDDVQRWFHAAGGLAVINVLVAVFWR